MKSTVWCVAVCGMACALMGFRATAQSQTDLDIQVYAGLTITGEVGTVYSIESVANLAEATEGDWRSLEFLQLQASPYLWTDKTGPVTDKRFYRAVAMEAPTNMVFIPPGTFRMGSPEQVAVTISRGFWMGKYEVTQGEYLAVMGDNPSYFNGVHNEGTEWEIDYGIDLNRPVEATGWLDATEYCALLTERERSAGRIPANCAYRLPTEAEWEYACRAWTSAQFSYGDDPGYTNLTNYAWYGDDSAGQTHPVGEKLPNAWGLYDMHGNVAECCQGWWGVYDYEGGIAIDPQGPESGELGVARGGFWGAGAEGCRSTSRIREGMNEVGVYGFRVILVPNQP